MHKIKQVPEDFIVQEINNLIEDKNGKYYYFIMKKRNCNTLSAINLISRKLNIIQKKIGFAGNKDKVAVTQQIISIFSQNSLPIEKIENLNLNDIKLTYIGKGNNEISLGSNLGNEFFVTIRNLDSETIEKLEKFQKEKFVFPNFFGNQRFGSMNSLIGRAIIKKDFKLALDLILKSKSNFAEKMDLYIKEHNNDYINALRKIPFKLLKFYVHSYQSYIYNLAAENFTKTYKSKDNIKVPIIGFGTELEDYNKNISDIIKGIMKEEKTSFRDFIINEIKELSQEGSERELFAEADGFKIIHTRADEKNENKNKALINFFLKKGCYATVFIDELFKKIEKQV